jgi:ligand-binding SRPBCC domain-containing protein
MRLTPPPIFLRMHRVEPMAESAVSEFTMWFGPIPVRWVAVHYEVDQLHGFTDEQQVGPLARWVHTHRFTAESETVTRIEENIQYDHLTGLRGWLTRVLFSQPALWMLFTYRQIITRISLEPKKLRSKLIPDSEA